MPVEQSVPRNFVDRLAKSLARQESRLNQIPSACRGGSRFHLIRKIGAGGLGVVYLARDRRLARKVAVKIARRESPWRSPSQDRFLIECRITARLRHPGIPEIYASGRLPNGRRFYAMRWIRGESFAKRIANFHQYREAKSQTEPRESQRGLLRQFQSICETVHAAHEAGYLHRDLKPHNVMVEPTGATFVVDWGLARRLGSKASSTTPTADLITPSDAAGATGPQAIDIRASAKGGTPEFMAPEQIAGREADFNRTTDVYALGGILHCVLTGTPPRRSLQSESKPSRWKTFWRSKSLAALFRSGEDPSGELDFSRLESAKVDPELRSICRKALSHAQTQRYATARELHDDVARWERRDFVRAHRAHYRWSEHLGRYFARHARFVVPVMIGITLVGALLGLLGWQWGAATGAAARADAAIEGALNSFHGVARAMNSPAVLRELQTKESRAARVLNLVNAWKDLRRVAKDLPRDSALLERVILAANVFTETFADTVDEDQLGELEGDVLSVAQEAVLHARDLIGVTGETERSLTLLQEALKQNARVCSERGRFHDAIELAGERIQVVERLLQLNPGSVNGRSLLLNSRLRMAAVFHAEAMAMKARDPGVSFRSCWAQLELAREFVSQESNVTAFSELDLIALDQQSGLACHKLRYPEFALEFYECAHARCLWNPVPLPKSDDDDWSTWVAQQDLMGRILNGMGLSFRALPMNNAEQTQDNLLRCKESHQAALAIRQEIQIQRPWLRWPRKDVGMSWGNLADAENSLKNVESEIEARRRAVGELGQLIEESPSLDVPRGLFAVQAVRLFLALHRQQEDDEAFEIFADAVETVPEIEDAEGRNLSHLLGCSEGFCLLSRHVANPEPTIGRARAIMKQARAMPEFNRQDRAGLFADYPLAMELSLFGRETGNPSP
ncbi:MAG: serine/threonine-protein kinase [Planctomycetota bacterium]|nr:serine/threonine-protein kinase [Planctomycetota bacterium]